ncbi:NnrS family protein [Paenirhodobacter sp.]|uniref:NnrS family protein n=1 Tax=Paenirhodobacter sp. TaxID=1965326 RepID=UPI003B3DED44
MTLHRTLSDEGFRLFFPLAALYAALWPLLWAGVWGLDLPFARDLPPGVWHANEMIFGAWGAALIGFLTTAVPEWTDTPRLRGRALWGLVALWGAARVAGLLGADALAAPAGLCDLAWLAGLLVYLLRVSWQRRTTRILTFAVWVGGLTLACAAARWAMALGAAEAAAFWLRVAGLVYLGLLGLVLARVTVQVTNVILDPTGESTPFRPHPGRVNLAAGLVAVALAGEIAGLSPAVSGFLWIAAGAAFMDRIAEGFIGRAALRAEIVVLMASAGFAGVGLLAFGASRLGAPWAETPALHIALMGGLGLGILAVFAIAGRFHTGQDLGLHVATKAAFACVGAGVLLRALPEMGWTPWPPGPPYLLAAALWALGFVLWLADYWPELRRLRPAAGPDRC